MNNIFRRLTHRQIGLINVNDFVLLIQQLSQQSISGNSFLRCSYPTQCVAKAT